MRQLGDAIAFHLPILPAGGAKSSPAARIRTVIGLLMPRTRRTYRTRFALVLTFIGALATAGATPAQRVIEPKPAVRFGAFHSHALRGTVHYSVSLPKGYANSRERYPVVYYLHGLPANSHAFRSIGWLGRAAQETGRKAIVVGMQGARRNDPDAEWHDWGAGRDWETATAHELVGEIDQRYRTIAKREGRVLVGVSAGGYGAALIGYHHPGVFSVFQSWSGYFRPTNPSGTAVLDLGSKRANDWASLHAIVPKMRKRLGRYYRSTYFGFFVGSGDKRFLPDNRRLAREMRKAHVPNHLFRTYKGEHSTRLWRQEARKWIGRALRQAAPAR
jgi:endo-1,4-beta-xylanase